MNIRTWLSFAAGFRNGRARTYVIGTLRCRVATGHLVPLRRCPRASLLFSLLSSILHPESFL